MKKFYQISSKNTQHYNLTELNATESVNTGFMNHNDWVAHVARFGHVMDALQKRHATSILDVGCGQLNQLKYIWRNRSTFEGVYVGLDLRAKEAWLNDVGWSKGDINLVQMDITVDQIPQDLPQQYDVVVCTEVLEHIPRESGPELLRRLYAWTKPGGVCFLSTPNAGVSESTAENHLDENGVSREWTYQDKIKLAESVGFKVTNAWGTFIGIKHIPQEFLDIPQVQKIREFLPYSWFTVFAAGPHPDKSNNAIMELSK